jgi:hypothetical protein
MRLDVAAAFFRTMLTQGLFMRIAARGHRNRAFDGLDNIRQIDGRCRPGKRDATPVPRAERNRPALVNMLTSF